MISIIIPAHNCKSTIEKAIKSCFIQNCDVEVIVVENNSTDHTVDVLHKLASKYKQLKVYSTTKKGVSNARNEGLEHVTGDIVTFLDGDDYFEENVFNRVTCLFSDDCAIVCTMHKVITESRMYCNSVRNVGVINTTDAIDNILCNPPVMGSVWAKFYKREVIGVTRFREELTHMEDGCFNVEILSKNRLIKVLLSNIVTYNYVYNKNSATSDVTNLFDENNRLKYNNSVNAMIDNLDLTENEIKSCRDGMFRLSVGCINVTSSIDQYNLLYDIVYDNFWLYLYRMFRYYRKDRVKSALKGVYIILKGKC